MLSLEMNRKLKEWETKMSIRQLAFSFVCMFRKISCNAFLTDDLMHIVHHRLDNGPPKHRKRKAHLIPTSPVHHSRILKEIYEINIFIILAKYKEKKPSSNMKKDV